MTAPRVDIADTRSHQQLTKDDWVRVGLVLLEEQGEPGVTIENVAQRLRASKHDFQRYFSSVAELLDSILEYWEQALTEDIANAAKPEDIPPGDRIFGVMERVIESDAAKYDHAIWVVLDSRRFPSLISARQQASTAFVSAAAMNTVTNC